MNQIDGEVTILSYNILISYSNILYKYYKGEEFVCLDGAQSQKRLDRLQ